MAELDEAKKSLYVDMINEKIAARKPFTAYDITRDVRSQGNAVEHYIYKEVVHELFNGGQMEDFVRTLKPSPTGPCFLFHPPEFDATNYDVGKPASAILIPALPAPAYSPAAQAAAARNFDDDEEEDNEPDDEAEEESANVSIAAPPDPFKSGTGFPAPKPTIRKAGTVLYVPAPMGRHIGLQPGGEAFVVVDATKNEIRIGKQPGTLQSVGSSSKIHVDVNANVRINTDDLKRAGVGLMVRIGIKEGEIVITKAKAE